MGKDSGRIVKVTYDLLKNDQIESFIPLDTQVGGYTQSKNKSRDPRTGARNKEPCGTCGYRLETGCIGHFGRVGIKEDNPPISPPFIPVISPILRHACLKECLLKCKDKISIYESQYLNETKAIKRAEILKTAAKFLNDHASDTKCLNSRCNKATPAVIYSVKHVAFKYKDKPETIDNRRIKAFLANLSEFEKKILGVSSNIHEVFFGRHYIIPPNCTRENAPSDRSKNIFESGIEKIMANTQNPYLLQMYINRLCDNSYYSASSDNNYKVKDVLTINVLTDGTPKSSFLKARIIAGKQNVSARAPLVSAPVLTHQLELPAKVFQYATKRIYYNKFTKNEIDELLRLNKVRACLKKTGPTDPKPYTIQYINENINMKNYPQIGDLVEIPIKEGDPIFNNRNPTLWRCNITSPLAVKCKDDTIGMPTEETVSYNADFDGDECNIHISQSPIFRIELILNSSVVEAFIDDATGATNFGINQDQILMVYRIYKLDKIKREDMVNLLGNQCFLIDDINKREYTGVEVVSSLLPDNMTVRDFADNGELIIPCLTGKNLASRQYDTIINYVTKLYGKDKGLRCLRALRALAGNAILKYTFSTPYTDIFDSDFMTGMKEYIDKELLLFNEDLKKLYNDIEDNIKATKERDSEIKDRLKSIESKALDKVKEWVKTLDDDNAVKMMYEAGYKISDDVLKKSFGCEGLFLEEEDDGSMGLPKMGFNARLTSYHLPNSDIPSNMGFNRYSYAQGSGFIEYYLSLQFVAIPAIKMIKIGTAAVGYQAAKIRLRMKTTTINSYCMTVHLGTTVLDHNANVLKMAPSDICKISLFKPNKNMIFYEELNNLWNNKILKFILSPYRLSIQKTVGFYIDIESHIKSYKPDKPSFIHTSDTLYDSKINIYDPLDPKMILSIIDQMIDYMSIKMYYRLQDMSMVEYILKYYFDPSLYNFPITLDLILYIYKKITFAMSKSLSPGDPVGARLASNLTERLTQDVLSNFHLTKKSGSGKSQDRVNDSQVNMKRTTDLSGKNKSGDKIRCYSINKKPLLELKRGFEYSSLYTLDANISTKPISYENRTIITKIQINKNNLIKDTVDFFTLNTMINNYIVRKNNIESFSYTFAIDDINVTIIIYIKFIDEKLIQTLDMQINALETSMPYTVNKGREENINIDIEDNIEMVDDNGDECYGYKIEFKINDINDLVHYDLYKVHIELSPVIVEKIRDIDSCRLAIIRSISNIYKASAKDSMYAAIRILALILTSRGKSRGIGNIQEESKAVILASASNKRANANAAAKSHSDFLLDPYSCAANLQPSPQCGYYYRVFLRYSDMLKLMKMKLKKDISVDDKSVDDKIDNVIEDF